MTSSHPSFSGLIAFMPSSSSSSSSSPNYKYRNYQTFQLRAQSFRDEGRSSNIVDTNMMNLRERIELVRIKERLERCCIHQHGWNYSAEYNCKGKRNTKLTDEFFQCIGTVGVAISMPIVSGTLCLCLISFLAHLNN